MSRFFLISKCVKSGVRKKKQSEIKAEETGGSVVYFCFIKSLKAHTRGSTFLPGALSGFSRSIRDEV